MPLSPELILAEGRRALDQQHTDLVQVRSRAATLVTWASAGPTILGGLIFTTRQQTHSSGWAWWAAGVYALLVVVVVVIHWPWTMTLYADAAKLVDDFHTLEDDEAQRHLARMMSGWRIGNAKVLDWLLNFYIFGTILLPAESILVLLALKG